MRAAQAAQVIPVSARSTCSAAALLTTWRSRSDAAEARLEQAQLKREFLERSSLSRQVAPDKPKEWRDESRALLRWYFDELAASRNRHPGAARAAEAARPAKGKEKEDQARAEWQRYAQERLAARRPIRESELQGFVVSPIRRHRDWRNDTVPLHANRVS